MPKFIELDGVRVHNLKGISVRLPLGKCTVITGVSGAGKTSLAFDTLYAESQRRYIETFSTYARQFLARLEKPDADRIEHVPPAIAVRRGSAGYGRRATVATTTEIHDHWAILFSKVGRIVCPHCNRDVRAESPEDVAEAIAQLPAGTRVQIASPIEYGPRGKSRGGDAHDEREELPELLARLPLEGFPRVVIGGQTLNLPAADDVTQGLPPSGTLFVIVDRLVAGQGDPRRGIDSIEAAYQQGHQRAAVFAQGLDARGVWAERAEIDGQAYAVARFSERLICDGCGKEFLAPEARLFSFRSPLGACPTCHGFGTVVSLRMDRAVPDGSKSLLEGALAPYNIPELRRDWETFAEFANRRKIPLDVPYEALDDTQRDWILAGEPRGKFHGLRGLFEQLERRRLPRRVRNEVRRFQSREPCPACGGSRLRSEALAVRLEERSIAEVLAMPVATNLQWVREFDSLEQNPEAQAIRPILTEIDSRLAIIERIGLGHVALDRAMRTLSSGEAQRLAIAATLGSRLASALYVFDEPSAGLHPHDVERVLTVVQTLRQAGNTTVIVEHDANFIRAADHVVDLGPGAGTQGGRVMCSGTLADILACADSATGRALAEASQRVSENIQQRRRRREPTDEVLSIEGAAHHTLRDVSVEFPLGRLVVVTGVSGSGKTLLIEQTLYPALCAALGRPDPMPEPGRFRALRGAEHVGDVVLVDQSPVSRSPRSNPITFVKGFDEIRKEFAETADAKLRNYTPAHFSFNAEGGRCPNCRGSGSIQIDMQFLPDVTMVCPECGGARYRPEILEVKSRGLNIAEVLAMPVGEAISFFKKRARVLKRLKPLRDVGLDYLPLGQSLSTLSAGETQRLKLAAYFGTAAKPRTLFLIDEPTTGLHPADVTRLLETFERFLSEGHSLIVIEHDPLVVSAADHVIDMGPGAGEQGGRIVATGTPEEILRNGESLTGRCLKELFH